MISDLSSETDRSLSIISDNSDSDLEDQSEGDDYSDGSSDYFEESNTFDFSNLKNQTDIVDLDVCSVFEKSMNDIVLYDFPKDLKVSQVIVFIDTLIHDSIFEKDHVKSIMCDELKQLYDEEQINQMSKNGRNTAKYDYFVRRVTNDKEGTVIKNETHLSDVSIRKCINVILKKTVDCSRFEMISLYLTTIIYMSSQKDEIFEQVMQLMERQFDHQKDDHFIWAFFILYFCLDEYEIIFKMMDRKVFKKKIGKKDTVVLSQMIIHQIISIQNEVPYNEKRMKNLIDFVINLHKLDMICISQMFWIIFNEKGDDSNFFNSVLCSSCKKNDNLFMETMKQYSKDNTYHNFTIKIPLIDVCVRKLSLSVKEFDNVSDISMNFTISQSSLESNKQKYEYCISSFYETKWLSCIVLDMKFVDRFNFIHYLEQLWTLLQKNDSIYAIKFKRHQSFYERDYDEEIFECEKTMSIYKYCFYKENKQMIQEITTSSMKNRKIMDNLIDKINKCVKERNYMVQQFNILLKNEKYDLCDSFLEENSNCVDFIFFNCFNKTIKDKLHDVRCVKILLKYDFDWSCSQPHNDKLYDNVFHILIENQGFRKDAVVYLNLFEKHKIDLKFEKEWNTKNEYGISMHDFCDFLGYNHLFEKEHFNVSEKHVELNLDQNIWNNIVEFIEFDHKMQHSFWLARINKCTNTLTRQLYYNELFMLFKEKLHSLQYFIMLFCSLYYNISSVKELLLGAFYENLCLFKEDADSMMEESDKWIHDKNNESIHYQKVTDLFFLNESIIENIEKSNMKSDGIEAELFEFSKNRFFDFFGLTIEHQKIKYFLCTFVYKVQICILAKDIHTK